MKIPTHQYQKAPITEAIIDIQVELPPVTNNAILESLSQVEAVKYPNKNPLMQGVFQLDVASGASVSQQQQLGLRLSTADQKQVVLIRTNGFSFSRLNPYEGWHIFQPEAQRLWNSYKTSTNPMRITRVAIRYVNRIDLPSPSTRFEAYLTTLPKISSNISQEPGKFFMQLQIPQDDIQATLILTEALVEPPVEKASILLDIDIFRDKNLPEGEQSLWELFEKFHSRKNEIFEACITQEVRRLID